MFTDSHLYYSLIQHLPETLVILYDTDLRVTMVEGTLPGAFGVRKEDLDGQSLRQYLPEPRLPLYQGALQGTPIDYEDSHDDRVYSHQLTTLYDEGNLPFAGMLVVRDITRQKRKEQRLLQNEMFFRGLFENNNDAVFIIGLEGRVQAANARAIDLFGYTLDEMPPDFALEILATQHDTFEAWLDHLRQEQTLPFFEREFVNRDGETFHAEISVTLSYNLDSQPTHIQCIVRDITERKRIESQLGENVDRLITLHQVDAELADRLSMEYVLSMALDAAIRLSGADVGFISLLDDENIMHIAKMVGEYPPGLEESHLRQRRGIIGRVTRTHEPEVIFDVRRDPDYIQMHPRTIAQMVIPLVSQERLIGVLNLESSRTDRFSYEVLDFLKLVTARIAVAIDNARLYNQSETQLAQLRDLYSQVSHLEQIKTDMIRIASHDLRNPLSAILGFIELLELDLSLISNPGETVAHLGNMERAARRIEKIIDDILSLERIEESAQMTPDQYADLTTVVTEVYEEVEPQARLHSRSMVLELPPGPTIVRGHDSELAEAAANLIQNAIKYTRPEGQVVVRLKVVKGRVVFEVQDDGIGIKPEHLEKLFQPFFRVSSEDTRNIEGTGLGLHLVKKIIERHGGKMLVSSEYGNGSNFGFSLPLAMD